MDNIQAIYVLNAILLLLHEIESAYEKEWEILKLPGAITGFLLVHIPVIFLLFYGLLEVERKSNIGLLFCIFFGVCGVVPFIVHKILVRKENHFNLIISNIIIYLNVVSGAFLIVLSLFKFP